MVDSEATGATEPTPPDPRDHSLTPDTVREWVEGEQKAQVEAIKLTRLGHFHAGDGEKGQCRAAVVVGVTETGLGAPTLVSLRVYPNGRYDTVPTTGAGQGETAQPVGIMVAPPSDEAGVLTFHLSRTCPWHR